MKLLLSLLILFCSLNLKADRFSDEARQQELRKDRDFRDSHDLRIEDLPGLGIPLDDDINQNLNPTAQAQGKPGEPKPGPSAPPTPPAQPSPTPAPSKAAVRSRSYTPPSRGRSSLYK